MRNQIRLQHQCGKHKSEVNENDVFNIKPLFCNRLMTEQSPALLSTLITVHIHSCFYPSPTPLEVFGKRALWDPCWRTETRTSDSKESGEEATRKTNNSALPPLPSNFPLIFSLPPFCCLPVTFVVARTPTHHIFLSSQAFSLTLMAWRPINPVD